MRKILIVMAAAVLISAMYSAACAQHVSMGFKASTLGAGLEAGFGLSNYIGARVGVNYFDYDYDGTKDDIDYEFELNLMSVSALLDWHPLGGSFRISGGVLYSENSIDVEAKSSLTYEIGDTTYTAAQVGSLTGEVEFNDMVPYLGIGWDTSFGKSNRFGFIADLGAIYQDSPIVEFTTTGPVSSLPSFRNDLAKEEENLQEDIDSYKYYPVISLGFNYRF
jgi:hypothetical protein